MVRSAVLFPMWSWSLQLQNPKPQIRTSPVALRIAIDNQQAIIPLPASSSINNHVKTKYWIIKAFQLIPEQSSFSLELKYNTGLIREVTILSLFIILENLNQYYCFSCLFSVILRDIVLHMSFFFLLSFLNLPMKPFVNQGLKFWIWMYDLWIEVLVRQAHFVSLGFCLMRVSRKKITYSRTSFPINDELLSGFAFLFFTRIPLPNE